MSAPWPGEQLDFYDRVRLAGTINLTAYPGGPYYVWRANRPNDDPGAGTSSVISAGNDFYFYSASPTMMLSDADTIGEANWIFDVVALSGTAQVYLGVDEGWNYDDAAIAASWVPVGPLVEGRNVFPLPEEYRTYTQLRNNLAPLFRVEVTSGTLEASRLTLQIEPLDGLKRITGYTPSDWLTPPTVTQGAKMSSKTHTYQSTSTTYTSSAAYHHSGAYNEAGSTVGHVDLSPTWLEVLNEAVDALYAGTLVDTAWSTPSYVSGGLSCTQTVNNAQPNAFNLTSLTDPGFDYVGRIQSIGGGSAKQVWENITTVRSAPAVGGTAREGRDYTRNGSNQTREYAGDSSSVGWTPGYIVPVGVMVESRRVYGGSDSFPSTNASPHGDSYSLSGTTSQTVAGSSFPVHSSASSWAVEDVSAISVSPVAGSDVEMSGAVSFSDFADAVAAPWGTFETDLDRVESVTMSVSWKWTNLISGRYYPAQPQLVVQPPNYRYFIPTFELSPDAVTGSGPTEPTPLFTLDTPLVHDAGEYVYEGDVGAGAAAPVLWVLYKPWAFLGNHIVVYGQGLGNTQGELHGVLKLGPGLDFPLTADVTPTIISWTLNAAGSHAYDGTGVVFPGTEAAPPRVDVEVQTIEFVVPPGMTLDAPTEMHVYVTNDHGQSNALSLMLYPLVDVDMQSAAPLLSTMSRAMSVWTPPIEDVIEQHYSLLPAPFALTSPIPERPPLFLTNAAPDFALTGGSPTTGLDDPVDVTLPLLLRYRPLDSKIEPRPDLGTGVSAWNSNEGSSMDWRFFTASGPYVDDTTTVASRNGELVRPAMVFPGTAWAETTNAFAAGPRFTIAMAVTVYPDAIAQSYLLSGYAPGADPDAFDLRCYVEGDNLVVWLGTGSGGRPVFTKKIAPGYIGQRPIILALTLDPTTMRIGLVSDRPVITTLAHKETIGAGYKLYLGRSNESDVASMRMATMDVLDLGLDTTFCGIERFWAVVNRLDAAYGVAR